MLNFLKRYKFLILILAFLIVVGLLIAYYTDYLWYQSLGVTQVFLKPLLSELGLKLVLWLLGFAFLLANLLPMADQFKLKRRPRVVAGIEVIQQEFNLSKKVLVLLAFLISIFWVGVLPQMWDKLLLLLNSSPVGQADPILGHDLSYYFFSYPLYSVLSAAFLSLLSLTVTVVLIGYIIGSAINFAGLRTQLAPKAIAHFSALLAAFLLWFVLTGQFIGDTLVGPPRSRLYRRKHYFTLVED